MKKRSKKIKTYEIWWSDHYNMLSTGPAKTPRKTPQDAPDYVFIAEYSATSWENAKRLAPLILANWMEVNRPKREK